MTRIRPLSLLLVPALALGIGACDDGTSPVDFHGMDAVGISEALLDLVGPMQAASEPAANLDLATEDLRDAGINLEIGSDEEPVHFPPEVVGRTFAYDTSLPGWQIDESFDDVGAAVRVLWYARDGSGEVAVPLQLNGYIDLRPAAGAEAEGVTVRAVDTRDGETELLDYTQTFSVSENGVRTDSIIEAQGQYSNGARTVDFTFMFTVSNDAGSGDSESSLTASLQDADTEYQFEFGSLVDGATGSFDDRIVARVQYQGATTVLETAGQFPDEVAGEFRHAGAHIVDIFSAPGGVEYRDEEGNSPSASQATDLNGLYNALTSTWVYLLNLLFFVPLQV